MNKPLVIFDLDGTLLDTLASIAAAFNQSLGDLDAPPREVRAFRHIVGDGARVAAGRCLPDDRQTDDEIEQCMRGFQRYYASCWSEAKPYDGIKATLDSLKEAAWLAVLSNKDEAFTRRCVEHYFPGMFDQVVGYRPELGHKPDPAGGLHILNRLNVAADDSMLVGDTATDMNTAAACKMRGVGVLWGFRNEQELRAAGADHIISHPSDLTVLLKNL